MSILSEERKNKGLTQIEAAKRIGISYSMLAKLETDNKNASKETMKKISEFYDKPVDYLFFAQITH